MGAGATSSDQGIQIKVGDQSMSLSADQVTKTSSGSYTVSNSQSVADSITSTFKDTTDPKKLSITKDQLESALKDAKLSESDITKIVNAIGNKATFK